MAWAAKDNIESLENCFTRLRVNVKDESLVNEDLINHMKNSGIMRKGKDIQIILGMQVAQVRGPGRGGPGEDVGASARATPCSPGPL